MKIAIYTDDAPISEDKLASGMNRVNTRLFNAIKENITIIATSSQHVDFTEDDLDKKLLNKIVHFKENKLFSKILRKISNLLTEYFTFDLDVRFLLHKYNIINSIIASGSTVLFVPLGSNIRAYKRAIYISDKTKLPLVVYIVDDFLDAAILSNDKYGKIICQQNLRKFLHRTNKIFVISEGMQEYLMKNYNINSIVLNLPFKKKYIVTEKTVKQVLFLGSLSHFYEDGLIELLEVLTEYNKTIKDDIILRLTSDKLPHKLEKYKSIVKYSRIQGDENLAIEINKSLFCFIPYSFANKYHNMVATSFPSKTLECLSYAKHVVVYGPYYSSVVKYFKKNSLQTYIDVNNKKTLEEFIKKVDIKDFTISNQYLEIINNYHSFDYIKKTILENIQ
jgi:hypothetical protein